MNRAYNMVKEFHTACSIEMPATPTKLDNGGHNYTIDAYAEELDGLVKRMKFASAAGFGGQVLARASYMLEEMVEFLTAETIEDQVDALCDLQYFSIGTNTLIGVNPEPIFNIVQAANMAKLGPDGKVKRNEQGKILKPEGWEAPEAKIKKEIERQTRSAECTTCNGTSQPIYGLECDCR